MYFRMLKRRPKNLPSMNQMIAESQAIIIPRINVITENDQSNDTSQGISRQIQNSDMMDVDDTKSLPEKKTKYMYNHR